MKKLNGLGWLDIFRVALVQTALGAIVVLTTSTMNRVMVVELALPAMVPGALVALHYAVQMLRPRMGHGSDVGGRRTPWIIGGMCVLATGHFGGGRHSVGSAGVLVNRRWCGCCRYIFVGLSGQQRVATAQSTSLHDHVDDDDRGLCSHSRHGRTFS
jgi:BCD family chlorophyll transporter-like MFS transporter